MRKINTSVILPTYDESGHIIELVEAIKDQLSKERISYEIIIVDDDSPDKTGVLAQKYFAKSADVRVIIRKRDRGLSAAIRCGIELAVGEVIVVMDTDFNHSPVLIPKLVAKCKRYDFVIGSRYITGGGMENKLREKLSYWFNIILRVILFSPVHDNLSGFFAIRREQLEKVNYDQIFNGYGEYFIRLIYQAKKNGATFAEIPCFYKNRIYGYSKSRFFSMFRDYMKTALSQRLS